MNPQSLRSIYQLKIILPGTDPPVSRQLQISSSATLRDLHAALQVDMGRTDSHMHLFAAEDEHYGVVDHKNPEAFRDQGKYRLDKLMKQEND